LSKTIHTRIQNKHDIQANWERATFVPLAGELIIYDDHYFDAEGNKVVVADCIRYKIGDGITPINELPFADKAVDQTYNSESENAQSGTAVKAAIDSKTTYSNSDPIVTTIGGIAAGTTFENVPVTDLLTSLLYPYTKPVINSFTLSPSAGVKKKGVSITLTSASAKATKKSKAIDTIALYKGSTLLKSVSGTSITSAGTIVTFSDLSDELTGTSNTTYTVKVSEKDGTANVATSTATYTFVDPYYHGVISKDATIDATLISGLTEKVEAKGTKSYSYTTASDQCAIIAYPASYGTIKEIKDPNNFTQTWTVVEVTINNVLYYVYISAAAAATDCTYKFSY
jgi:hypothetical protein